MPRWHTLGPDQVFIARCNAGSFGYFPVCKSILFALRRMQCVQLSSPRQEKTRRFAVSSVEGAFLAFSMY